MDSQPTSSRPLTRHDASGVSGRHRISTRRLAGATATACGFGALLGVPVAEATGGSAFYCNSTLTAYNALCGTGPWHTLTYKTNAYSTTFASPRTVCVDLEYWNSTGSHYTAAVCGQNAGQSIHQTSAVGRAWNHAANHANERIDALEDWG
jgi:hypothetical protein